MKTLVYIALAVIVVFFSLILFLIFTECNPPTIDLTHNENLKEYRKEANMLFAIIAQAEKGYKVVQSELVVSTPNITVQYQSYEQAAGLIGKLQELGCSSGRGDPGVQFRTERSDVSCYLRQNGYVDCQMRPKVFL